MVKCSLCKMPFDKDDPLFNERKRRHEEKHTRGHNNNSRSKGGGNNIIGKVEWI